jgi:hypothetical protein
MEAQEMAAVVGALVGGVVSGFLFGKKKKEPRDDGQKKSVANEIAHYCSRYDTRIALLEERVKRCEAGSEKTNAVVHDLEMSSVRINTIIEGLEDER